eukprot:350426-Chlamydomonas_euryale.AAC.5
MSKSTTSVLGQQLGSAYIIDTNTADRRDTLVVPRLLVGGAVERQVWGKIARGVAGRECGRMHNFGGAARCVRRFEGFPSGSNRVRWEANVKNGVCAASFDRKDIEMNKFSVGCLEAQFHVFDARTQHPKKVRGSFIFVCGGKRMAGWGEGEELGCLEAHFHSFDAHAAPGESASSINNCRVGRGHCGWAGHDIVYMVPLWQKAFVQ